MNRLIPLLLFCIVSMAQAANVDVRSLNLNSFTTNVPSAYYVGVNTQNNSLIYNAITNLNGGPGPFIKMNAGTGTNISLAGPLFFPYVTDTNLNGSLISTYGGGQLQLGVNLSSDQFVPNVITNPQVWFGLESIHYPNNPSLDPPYGTDETVEAYCRFSPIGTNGLGYLNLLFFNVDTKSNRVIRCEIAGDHLMLMNGNRDRFYLEVLTNVAYWSIPQVFQRPVVITATNQNLLSVRYSGFNTVMDVNTNEVNFLSDIGGQFTYNPLHRVMGTTRSNAFTIGPQCTNASITDSSGTWLQGYNGTGSPLASWLIGDGSGWRMSFSKRTGSVTTEESSIFDNGFMWSRAGLNWGSATDGTTGQLSPAGSDTYLYTAGLFGIATLAPFGVRVVVASGGNVGIGPATAPAAKLDVQGDIRASTTITATNGLFSIDAAGATVAITNGVIGAMKAATNSGNIQTATLTATTVTVTNGYAFPAAATVVTLTNIVYTNVTLNFPSTATVTFSDLLVNVANLKSNDVSTINAPATSQTNGIYTSWISNTVLYARFHNYQATAIDPTSGIFNIQVFQYK